jgi:hypothetical protein
MERRIRIVACLVLGISVGRSLLALAEEPRRNLSTEPEIEAYVLKLTGFEKLEGITKRFERVDINDVNTPFLHGEISARKNVWCVQLRNVRLAGNATPPPLQDKYVRTFNVFVDPNTGHLLKITSKSAGRDPNMVPEPPAQVAEEQIRTLLAESYLGFPNEPPNVSLLDALGAGLLGDPLSAKEIDALYVIHLRKGMEEFGVSPEPQPRWVITLRGVLPLELPRPHTAKDVVVRPWLVNHSRNVVDAATGKCLMRSNIPQPVPANEEK